MNTELVIQAINELIDDCYATQQAGQWPKRTIGEDLALMHSELSEALEDYRSGYGLSFVTYKDSIGKDGNKVDKPLGFSTELADVLVRIFAFCGEHEIDLGKVLLE